MLLFLMLITVSFSIIVALHNLLGLPIYVNFVSVCNNILNVPPLLFVIRHCMFLLQV